MSAAEVLTSLLAAGAELAAEAEGLRVRAPGHLPRALLAATQAAKPALLRVASGRWRLDLAGWPDWRREAFEERAALREYEGGQGRDLAERCAYLEAAELPDLDQPPADPKVDGAALEAPELPAHLADTPEAWAAFLDSAPWIGPAERRRILADVAG